MSILNEAGRWRPLQFLGATMSVLVAAPLTAQSPTVPDTVVELPAVFREHRVYLRPVTVGGDTLIFYTDTGGGANMVYAPAAVRLNLLVEHLTQDGDTVTLTPWPQWSAADAIPSPADTTGPFGGRLLIVPMEGQAAMLHDPGDVGFLGRLWFADRVWTFDYPAARLLLRPPGNLPPHNPEERVPLGFQTSPDGQRTTHFPRISVTAAADSLDLLFDTGATMTLTDSALSVLGDGRPARRASSFISAALFDRWRAEHPGWRVIERATSFGADLIELPEIEIAGQRVGPVWFERRALGTFEDRMSRWMDRQIVGALGGNAMRFFRVTVDYPNAYAVFQRQ